MDDRTKKQMQEAITFLNSPEAREARRLLSRPEVQEALRHLQSPEAQARLRDLQRPETRRFLEEIRRPEFRRFYEETMRYAREAGAGRAKTAIPKFSIPTGVPFGARLPLDVGANAVQAASEAARTAHAEAFRHSAADLARSVRISLSPEAAASAQLAVARRFLGSALPTAATAASLASLQEARRNYAETLRQARDLLSDPTLRQIVESADADALVAEGLETAAEVPESFEEDITVEEINILLDPDGDVEILIPWLNWAIIVFGIAWIIVSGDPALAEYKEPLQDILTKLGILKSALEMWLKDQRGEGGG